MGWAVLSSLFHTAKGTGTQHPPRSHASPGLPSPLNCHHEVRTGPLLACLPACLLARGTCPGHVAKPHVSRQSVPLFFGQCGHSSPPFTSLHSGVQGGTKAPRTERCAPVVRPCGRVKPTFAGEKIRSSPPLSLSLRGIGCVGGLSISLSLSLSPSRAWGSIKTLQAHPHLLCKKRGVKYEYNLSEAFAMKYTITIKDKCILSVTCFQLNRVTAYIESKRKLC